MIRASIFLCFAVTSSCVVTNQHLGGNGRDGGTDQSVDSPDNTVPDGSTVTTVFSLGSEHGCMLTQGVLRCWGRQHYGQLGMLDDRVSSPCGLDERCTRSPYIVPGLASISQVAVGHAFTCAIQSGTILCWGQNSFGQLALGGLPDSDRHVMPQPIRNSSRVFRKIAAGRAHICAISEDHTVWCWGANHRRQLGVDGAQLSPCSVTSTQAQELGISGSNIPCTTTPVQVPVSPASEVWAAQDQTCVQAMDGAVWCWGANDWAQLGFGSASTTDAPPTQTGFVSPFVWAMGSRHSCMLNTQRDVYCWGADDYGQLGLGTVVPSQCGTMNNCRAMPSLVASLQNVEMLAAGGDRSCAVLANGSVWCWGSSQYFGLGLHTPPTTMCNGLLCSRVPLQQRMNVRPVFISLGLDFGCFSNAIGEPFCWGRNDYRQSGGGDNFINGVEFPSQLYP